MLKRSGCNKMAGLSQGKHEREKIIEEWMQTVSRDGGLDRYDDLHIDRIDESWASRASWMSAALEAFSLAVAVRNRRNDALSVVLAFSLESGPHRRGADFETSERLAAQLDWTPPSLYLFRTGKEPWTQTGSAGSTSTGAVAVEKLDCAILGPLVSAKECVYMEFRLAGADEYSRSVFVVG
jgi:hypothetical protein